jgi:hypothetical protein
MSCTQLAFNSGDLAFQEIITSRPYRDSDRPIAPLVPVCRPSGSNLTANTFVGTDLRPRGPLPNAMTERKRIDSAEFAEADF